VESAFRVIGRRTVADTGFVRLDRLHLAAPDGAIVRVSVEHPGAVAVVPLDGSDVVLIRQYRAAISAALLEIPAGKLDGAGESWHAAATRELVEEVGLEAGNLDHLMTIHTSPGFANERIAIFRATELRAVPSRPVGAEEQAAEVVTMSFDAALDAVAAGEITDAKTIIGLFAAREAS